MRRALLSYLVCATGPAGREERFVQAASVEQARRLIEREKLRIVTIERIESEQKRAAHA